ncbi:hypothetical protein I3842_04G088200 [Carya illinoinensis]|uniref:Protein kinase domain-containing protein n=1 Tax=Carya illinoinensis TaxID=32201 RepID=A0A922JU75_CARIL|nr:hypothetical protein I3842_04G088200 [Carya illinoinensis]
MGCTLGKPPTPSPPRHIERLKSENGYVRGRRPIDRNQLPKDSAAAVPINCQVEDKHIVGAVNTERDGGGDRVVVREREKSGNASKRFRSKKIGGDELVGGWPKWLVDNVPGDLLSGLVSKSADSYDKLAKIRQGTYSNVYKARDTDTKKIVALKKVRFDTTEPESVKFMAREIKILKMLDHPNVIKLEGLATSRMDYSLYPIFNFMESDLTGIIPRLGETLNKAQVKCYMQQLLSGLQHCHERGLIDRRGVLKIADFGHANLYNPEQKQLLLGSTDYGAGIDLWRCLLAKMFVGRPFMPGRTEVEQLHRIFKLCGSPSVDYWNKMKLPASFPPYHLSFGLLTTLLALDPTCRGSAASALHSEVTLPIPRKKKNQSKTRDQKMRRTSKTKQSTRTKDDGHQGKKLIIEQPTEDFDSNKELVVLIKRGAPTTEFHPNALKNIKNPTLLQAYIRDIINPNEGKILPHYRRSLSSIDFRSLDLEKIAKLYEFDKDKAIKDNPP